MIKMNYEKRLYDQFKEAKERVTSYNIGQQSIGIFLYGSQNYNADLPDSDVDSKIIYVPTLEELCFKEPISKDIKFDNGEHCEIKDIREMAKMFKKQNINFLEILYTDYFILNPKYEKVWRENFLSIKDKIVRMDIRATVKSITGQIYNKLDKYPENGKEVSNALRFNHFLRNFLAGRNYKDCIDIKTYEDGIPQLIIGLKNNDYLPTVFGESIKRDTQKLINRLDDFDLEPNKETSALIDKAVLNIITNNNADINFYKEGDK